MSLMPVNVLRLCYSRLECMVSLLYVTACFYEACRNVVFYHWGRNLGFRARHTNSAEFAGGYPYGVTR